MACIMSAASLTAADLKEAPMPDILKDVRRILFYMACIMSATSLTAADLK